MVAAVLSSWALLLGMALLMMGNGLQGSLLGVRASLEAFPTAVTGLLMSGFYAGFLAGSVLAPRLVLRVGHVRVFAALASLASAAILIHAVFVEPATWGVMRLTSGFCYAGLYVIAESWLNKEAQNETRGRLLSIYMVISLGGMALGQGLLNVADPQGANLFILVSVLISLSLIPMLLSVTRGPTIEAPSPVGVRALYRVSPTGVVGIFATVMAHAACFGMGAVYGREFGLSVPQISLVMGLILLGGVVLQWPIGRMSDVFDRRQVMAVVTFLAAAFAVLANFMAEQSPLGLYVLVCLFGGMTLPMYSLCLAYTNDYLEPEQMVDASGTLVLVGGIGACLGPVSTSAVMTLLGPSGFFWSLATIHAGIGLFVLYRMTRRPGVPLDEQGAHVIMPPRATTVATAMYAEAALEAEAEAEAAEEDSSAAE